MTEEVKAAEEIAAAAPENAEAEAPAAEEAPAQDAAAEEVPAQETPAAEAQDAPAESMADLGEALEKSYKHMGNGEFDTDTLIAWEKIGEYKESKEILTVEISGIVNKGVVALVEGQRGFIPASRLDVKRVLDTNEYLGKEIRVRVIEADMKKNKLILSAREILREEAEEAKKQRIADVKVGSVLEGRVDSIQTYGAFIDLGDGLSGLLHISQISEKRIKHPKDVLEEGQTVTVKVIKNQDGKIGLSMKALAEQKQREEREYVKLPKAESIGTSLGDLLKDIEL